MKKLNAEKTFFVGTDEEGEQFKELAEKLLAGELPEYDFTIAIAYQEGEEPIVVADNGKGEMVQDIDLEKKINGIINILR